MIIHKSVCFEDTRFCELLSCYCYSLCAFNLSTLSNIVQLQKLPDIVNTRMWKLFDTNADKTVQYSWAIIEIFDILFNSYSVSEKKNAAIRTPVYIVKKWRGPFTTFVAPSAYSHATGYAESTTCGLRYRPRCVSFLHHVVGVVEPAFKPLVWRPHAQDILYLKKRAVVSLVWCWHC